MFYYIGYCKRKKTNAQNCILLKFLQHFQGKWKNLQEVITWTCIPSGDGIEWSLREDCNKYTLTIEQLEQKAEKRLRTREYKIGK